MNPAPLSPFGRWQPGRNMPGLPAITGHGPSRLPAGAAVYLYAAPALPVSHLLPLGRHPGGERRRRVHSCPPPASILLLIIARPRRRMRRSALHFRAVT